MKPNPFLTLGVSGVFAGTVMFSAYEHNDGRHLHLPSGSAPITVTALASSTSTSTVIGGSTVFYNAIHDAEYLLPPTTTPLKSDGQTEKS